MRSKFTKFIRYDNIYVFALQMCLIRTLLLGSANWREKYAGIIGSMSQAVAFLILMLLAVLALVTYWPAFTMFVLQ